ncbi:LemA family protein [Spiroplasma diminutum]|uniref:LemA family protein n=1 Tax=Spiroplasma diminutum CUAS-1 TaxID=1276221 RepID=S5LVF1_9MOLU|nr:LemA family protein [Spiroplasma diminutum]AGR41779.1 LemA family protein [Spiroplasma diminutum CUAS-1]
MRITPEQEFNNINNRANQKPKRNPLGVLFWYLSFLLIIPALIHLGNINKLKKLNIKVSEAESGIDVQLKNRRDTLIKLIEAVQGSMKFEKELLSNLTSMRTGVSVESMGKNAAMLDRVSKQVTMQLENYPDIKSAQLVKELMSSTKDIEDNIAAARRIYNSNVSVFNQTIDVFPSNSAAAQLGYSFKSLFEITDFERQDIKIEF